MGKYIIKYKAIRKHSLMALVIGACCCNTSTAQTPSDSINQVGFGTQPSWMTTGAVSSISGSQLEKSFTTNIANTLFGQLPGLTVQQNGGEPGWDTPSINIRGLGTFYGSNEPFIVIDGFQSTYAFLQQMSPQEIESITLLKDAAATAIYGSKGANGVLLVTTKRGQEGKLKINFSIQAGFQQAARLPEFLGSYDYANLYNEALANDGLDPLYSAADIEAYRTGNDPLFHPDVDWYDAVLRKAAPIQNYNFSASGSSKTFRYYVLFNVINSKGLFRKAEEMSDYTKNSNYTRYNFRTNIDVNLSKRLTATVLLGGSVEDKANPGTNEDGGSIFDLMSSVAPNAFPVYVSPGMYGGSSIYENPLGNIMQKGYISSNGRSVQADLKLTEQLDFITKGLSITGAIGFNTYFKSYSNKTRSYARYSIDRDNAGEIVYTKFGDNTSLSGDESSSNQWRNYSLQATLNYNRTFGKHGVDALFMGSYNDYVLTGNDLSRKNIGMGGRFTYDYGKRYIAEFTFGYNGTENFPRGNRFGFFPAGSLGWVISNESFLKDNDIVNYLKVKGSYGMIGNDNIGGSRFMFDQYYNWGAYWFGTSNNQTDAAFEGTKANPLLTWEKEKKLNLGFEATLLNSIDLSFEYFNNHRYDILTIPYRTIPSFAGFSRPTMNLGKVDNQGLEAMARYTSNQKKEFTYYVEATAWLAKNKIKYNDEALQVNEYLYGTGHPINQPFMLEAIGFFKDEQDILDSPTQTFTDVQPGDIKYKDQNNDGIIDNNDYYPIGKTSMPELTLGLRAGFKFKGFDLSFLFQGAVNRSVYLSGKYFHAFQNDGKISSIALGRWTPETAETATYPRLSSNNNLNNYQYSSFWQRNGDFFKLRNIEIGYTIPKSLAHKIKLESARIFLNGTNLFSIDHMDGFTDPEVLTGYPATRTISMGVSVQL